MSNKNFLHTIVAPNLTDSNFGQSIQTQFDNINTNFQRLVSAAYLSGQDGNDVVVKDVPIYTENITVLDRTNNEIKVYDTIDVINEFMNADDVSYNFIIANDADDKYAFLYSILQQAVFTDFGLQLVETIFSEQPFTLEHHTLTYDVDGVETLASDLGYVLINEDLEYMFPSYSDTNRYPVWLAFVYSPVVRMFAIHDIDTDTITNICATQLYYFYDARIGSIQLLDDKYTANDFTDYTSFITISSNKNADGTYEINGTYTMSKSQDLPTLYYDNDAQEFCWKMNGIETNITAQGVKGDKGDSANCWFCRGVSNTVQENNDPMISVDLISYYTTDETGTIILRSVNNENCEIKNGDFVCVDVYNSDATNNMTYFDTIFGNVNVYTETTGDSSQLTYNVTRPYYTSVMSMIKNSPDALCEYLKRISGNGLDDALHGLFIPSYSSQSVVHMINSDIVDDNECLIIHPVSEENVSGALNSDDIPTSNSSQEKPNFIIDGYDSVDLKSSDLLTDGDVKCNDVECENINSNGNITATVNGISNVKIGVPVGTVIDFYGNEIPEGWMQIDDSENNDYGNINSYIELTKVSSSDDYDIIVKLNASNNYFKFTDERLINLYKVLCEEINDNVVDSGVFSQTTFENATNSQLQVFFLWPFDVITRSGGTVFRLFLRNYKTTSNTDNSFNQIIQSPSQNGPSAEQQGPGGGNQNAFT